MKSSDEMLDLVLRGLGDVQPAGSLEDRVLAKVRAHAASSAPWHEVLRRTLIAAPLWAFATAGVGALVIASFFFIGHHRPPENIARTSRFPKPLTGTAPVVANASRLPAPVARPHQPLVIKKTASISPHHPAAPSEPESLAMQEWHAASLPAPELPLTHEERLLQGFAYRGNTEELAVLTPAFRAAENAREQAEFQQFFKKPTNGDNE